MKLFLIILSMLEFFHLLSSSIPAFINSVHLRVDFRSKRVRICLCGREWTRHSLSTWSLWKTWWTLYLPKNRSLDLGLTYAKFGGRDSNTLSSFVAFMKCFQSKISLKLLRKINIKYVILLSSMCGCEAQNVHISSSGASRICPEWLVI